MRDSIDFARMDVSTLFRKLLIPTVLGLVFSAAFVITDGIFVGRGVGSDALAAVNITAPVFMITAGIGLMFGVGASVVAAIQLSRGKRKVAGINITQALVVSSLLMLALILLYAVFRRPFALALGSSEHLLPMVLEYMDWFVPFLIFSCLLSQGMFYIRMDGAPKYAMLCNMIPAVINIILDYIFIFEFGWGLMGAAFASSIGTTVGAVLILIYLTGFMKSVKLYPIKLSRTSLRLTARNVKYMVNLGSSAFLTEGAIACMMLLGNYVFMRYLGEDGVAAYSIACYFFPIIFMVYNAIAQSAQPIISYNHGTGDDTRVKKTFSLSLRTAVICGIFFFIGTFVLREQIVSLFIDPVYKAYSIAVDGLPYFASGYIFFGINIVCIGYLQSMERSKSANILTVLRGFVFMLLSFIFMPMLFGVPGIWLSVPVAEVLTFSLLCGIYFRKRVALSR